jgi:hypothetical protein
MGRANIQRKRFSHMSVILEAKAREAATTEPKEKKRTTKKRKEA